MALLYLPDMMAVRRRGDRRAHVGLPLPAGRCGKLSGMNLALRKPMNLPEFLERESRRQLRYEFAGFPPVAMSGGTPVRPVSAKL